MWKLSAAFALLAVTAASARADESSGQALFDVIDVNRDTVPAGTPVAFEAALTPTGPVEIASIPVYYSNEGAVDTGSTTVEGTITAAEKGRSFTVSYGGSRNFSERYVRGANRRYEVRGGTKVPSC